VSEKWRRAEAVPRVRLGIVAWSALSSGQRGRMAPRQGTLVVRCHLPEDPKWKLRLTSISALSKNMR
jgi:hypothetical protein